MEQALSDLFLPEVAAWFEEALGVPTPPQEQAWPAIARGDHTLLLSPTGSGKTLAAFLSAIDRLFRDARADTLRSGIDVVYISPLKALGNDIERNLEIPLKGIRDVAKRLGRNLPAIRTAIRTGDTSPYARQVMWKRPPHILITTPESLYLMLGSGKAADVFSTVRTVIVDEIHTMAGEKRGVHLSLSLERLQEMARQPVQRIGLSATQRPLEEIARFLGGQEWSNGAAVERPVTIVDATYKKAMDLQVVGLPQGDTKPGMVWPVIIPQVLQTIRDHRTTLVFCNARRLAERTADRLNQQYWAERDGLVPQGSPDALLLDGVPIGQGFQGTGVPGEPFQAHHGSISKETRLRLEQELKAGDLPALVGTSSLELGIDIGSVDVVVQLQSPKAVSQGLQRVGRSGHMVGQTSAGRIFVTHNEDAMEAAVVARGMLEGRVEETRIPRNCLDVLAQQIVAIASSGERTAGDVYALVRRAYSYRDLSTAAFEAVLSMLCGKYPAAAHVSLRPRLYWDDGNDRLVALPGSRQLSLTNGGTISDTGAFAVYLADGKTRIGELDEEFVYETRTGDVFILGSQTWRATEITDDRVIVAPAPGSMPRMPFWNGTFPWRAYPLSLELAQFRREVADRLSGYPDLVEGDGDFPPELMAWLQSDYALDENASVQVLSYVRHQLQSIREISAEDTIVVESFDDAIGDPRIVIHSPFGGRVNSAWALAITGRLREQGGIAVEPQVSDDGILFRFPEADAPPPLDALLTLTPQDARETVLKELPESALFGALFRQSAARALMLPGLGPRRRTPFWLQRLRARDLLQTVKGFDDFPIVLETYRNALQDALDMPHLEEVLGRIQSGDIRVHFAETVAPSPLARSLLYDFIGTNMYEWDAPRAERQIQSLTVDRELLASLFDDPASVGLLHPEAIATVTGSAQRTASGQARSPEELHLLIEELGDLTTDEIMERSDGPAESWLQRLVYSEKVSMVRISGQERWVSRERLALYRAAFQPAEGAPSDATGGGGDARKTVLRNLLTHSGSVTTDEVAARLGFSIDWISDELAALEKEGELVSGHFTDSEQREWIHRGALARMHRGTLTKLREEIRPVPFAAYQDFLLRWQHLHASDRLVGPSGLERVLQQLRAVHVIAPVWEREVLPARVSDFSRSMLDAEISAGNVFWAASGQAEPERARVRLLFRGEGSAFLPHDDESEDVEQLSTNGRLVFDFLRTEGASPMGDLLSALGLNPEAVRSALLELALRGLVTVDSWPAAMALLERQPLPSPASRQASSSLEADLGQRMGAGRRRYSPSLRRDVRRRIERQVPAVPATTGQWSAIRRFALMGAPLSPGDAVAWQAHQLLERYGVVTRQAVLLENGAWGWGLLSQEYQRMEMRGQLRRGYFVEGLPGVQYALPEVVDRLRDSAADDTLVVVNACDPANVYDVDARWNDGADEAASVVRPVARLPGNFYVFRGGAAVIAAESYGNRISATAAEAVASDVPRAVDMLARHVTGKAGGSARSRMSVATWNGLPVLHGEGRGILEQLGFYDDGKGMSRSRAV